MKRLSALFFCTSVGGRSVLRFKLIRRV